MAGFWDLLAGDKGLIIRYRKGGVVMPETLWQAFVYYLIRLVMFGAVAAGGIAAGIQLRKRKNAKEQLSENEN